MPKFDITSDVHWDLWVDAFKSPEEQIKEFELIFSHVIPKDRSDTLIIAGDIGHYVEQNYLVFGILKYYYKNIVWCHGNHDLYLISTKHLIDYNGNSFNRLAHMVEMANTIPGVHFLDGNVVNIDGVNIGGSCLWYDYSYGVRQFHLYKKYFDMLWQNWSDCIYIHGPDGKFDNIKYFQERHDACLNIKDNIDIFVSHMIPLNQLITRRWAFEHTSSFFVFNGKKLINKFKPKVWLYGHTHDHNELELNGTRFINRSFGYPIDRSWKDHPETSMNKFGQIEI